MYQLSSARALHRQAIALWPAGEPWDSRSAQVAAAAASIAELGALPTSPGSQRGRNWVEALRQYEAFWWRSGHAPREKTRNAANLPHEERRMGEWARRQRRFEDRLCRYQVLRLDVSPAFAWDPHEEAWQVNLQACTRRLRTTGTLPYLNAADPDEFALARWLGRQLRQLKSGSLLSSRAEAITALLAGGRAGAGAPER